MKRFVIYWVAGGNLAGGNRDWVAVGDLAGGNRDMEPSEARSEVYAHSGAEVANRVAAWMRDAVRGQHYKPTNRILVICVAGRPTAADEDAGPTYPYLFIWNDTKATIRAICREADVRYKIGPNIDGGQECPKGMYVHVDDLRKLKRFLRRTGQSGEAELCQEVMILADSMRRSVTKAVKK